MNYKIVWIGKYQEDIKNFEILGSISKYGVEKPLHFVFDSSEDKSYAEYITEKIAYFKSLDSDIKFYFYDQATAYKAGKHLTICDDTICVNSEFILNWLNNKSIAREWVRNIVKTPQTVVLSNEQIKLDCLKNLFWGYRRFVAQSLISSGGHKTFLIDSSHHVKLKPDLYIVSPYYTPSVSVNLTSILYAQNDITFPPSLQIIEEDNNCLLYKGSDFVSANIIPQNIYSKLISVHKKIIKQLSFLGYKGICGIDYLVYNDEVYFLEINPRFQGSSFLINKALEKYHLSLYQLNINAFNNIEEKSSVKKDLCSIQIPYCFQKDSANARIITSNRIIKEYPENLSTDYYDYFADKYHIMLKDWNLKIRTQGKILKHIIEKFSCRAVNTILDCTCGIGIQALSLAQEGYCVTGSDLSINELDVAKKEAKKRNLDINFIQADCRCLEKTISKTFDAVISIDSALPHLLTRDNFISAFRSIYERLNTGGVFLSSYRDYAALLKSKPNMAYPVRFNSENGIDYTILRKWIWEGEYIFSKQYVIADSPSDSKLYTNSYKQWAVTKADLMEIVDNTAYSRCYWLLPEDSGFSQPILCLVK